MKKRAILLTLLAVVFLFFGCSRKPQEYVTANHTRAGSAVRAMGASRSAGEAFDQAYAPETAAMSVTADTSVIGMDNTEATGDTKPNAERKLIKRASVRVRVENLEKADASVSGLMEKYDAYAASTNIEENSYSYSLRVPAPAYDTFLAEMNGIGRLLRRSENTEDVTLRYYDLEGRLVTKKELLKTYQSYLEKAKTIEEILSVERYISDLQYDIEGTGMQLRNLADRVDYATIDLTLLGPVASSPLQGKTFGERVKELFGSFGSFLSTLVMIIIGIIIFGIPILLLLALLYWLLLGRIGLMRKLWYVVVKRK
ncbi:MAG: DUF4349 domain-containing protein [Treponema sp.]|jgi:hypothetical protein|nr:DUF4349 domain-containing protein [Treponema sp.]